MKKMLENLIEKIRKDLNTLAFRHKWYRNMHNFFLNLYRTLWGPGKLYTEHKSIKKYALMIGIITLICMLSIAFFVIDRAKKNTDFTQTAKTKLNTGQIADNGLANNNQKNAQKNAQKNSLLPTNFQLKASNVFNIINGVDNEPLHNYYLYSGDEYYLKPQLKQTLFPREATDTYNEKNKFKELLQKYNFLNKQEENIQREINNLPN